MKKILFVMLSLLLWSAANVQAQVTIGSNANPHPGAALDIQSSKGLKLPVVAIFNANILELAGDADKATAVGIMVYNTNASMVDGRGEGVYVWNGSKWMFVAVSSGAAVPVTQISVSPSGTSVTSGQTQPFTATVSPGNATTPEVSWLVLPGTGSGTIISTGTSAGLFTAGSAGTVTVRATATDGSGVYGEQSATVIAAPVPVTNVSVTSAGGATGLNAGSTLQLTATVLPGDASNKAITWSIASGNAATVDQSGIVTGTGNGNVTVRATSNADNTIHGEITLTVTQFIGETTVVGSKDTYAVYCYPNNLGCWMTDNSKEGTPSRKRFGYADNETTPETVLGTDPNATSGARGYYYTWTQAANACPTGYHLPNETEWNNLKSYINGVTATSEQKSFWISGSALAGCYDGSAWNVWGSYGAWWSSGATHQLFDADASGMNGPYTESNYYFSVLCVKSN